MSRHRHAKKGKRIEPHKAVGAPPGTLTPEPHATDPEVTVYGFGAGHFEERGLGEDLEFDEWRQTTSVVWINVDGLGDSQMVERIGKRFGLHSLAMEDILTTHQRAKVDEYEGHLFVVARMIVPGKRVDTEQLSMVVGSGFVLTFQEVPGDCFDHLRDRLRRGLHKIRSSDSGFLAYSILDAVLDAYYPVLEEYGERLEELDSSIVRSPDPKLIGPIHDIKRDLLALRRAVWPLREAISTLIRDPSEVFSDEMRFYLRDLYDHAVQIIDFIETYREYAADLMDAYLSSISNRISEVMRVLTVISTIFIPLTFLVGVWGMNFDPDASAWNMPELRWPFGYLVAWAIMIAVTLGLLMFFRRRGWLGGRPASPNDESVDGRQ
jgi:magnesium transporter